MLNPTSTFANIQACIGRKVCADKPNLDDPDLLDRVFPKFINQWRDQTVAWPLVNAACHSISILNPLRKYECAAMMASYHIFHDLQNALNMEGCGTQHDWDREADAIRSCIDENMIFPFDAAARPMVNLMRDIVRANCLRARGE